MLGAPEPTDEELLIATLIRTHDLGLEGLAFEGTFLGSNQEFDLVYQVVRLALERGVLEQLDLEHLSLEQQSIDSRRFLQTLPA